MKREDFEVIGYRDMSVSRSFRLAMCPYDGWQRDAWQAGAWRWMCEERARKVS